MYFSFFLFTFFQNSLITTLTAGHKVIRNESNDVVASQDVLLVTASVDCSCKIWDVQSGTCLWTWRPHQQAVTSLCFHPSFVFLATGSGDCMVRVWDITRESCTHSFRNHSDIVRKVLFFPSLNRYLLASSSDDRTICVYNLLVNGCIYRFTEHTSPPNDFCFVLKGNALAAHARAEAQVREIRGRHEHRGDCPFGKGCVQQRQGVHRVGSEEAEKTSLIFLKGHPQFRCPFSV